MNPPTIRIALAVLPGLLTPLAAACGEGNLDPNSDLNAVYGKEVDDKDDANSVRASEDESADDDEPQGFTPSPACRAPDRDVSRADPGDIPEGAA
jgi:hypothetical protein